MNNNSTDSIDLKNIKSLEQKNISAIKKKIESGFIFLVLYSLNIFYWRATTIAPIKATKRIIEMSSNGRKKSVDK